MHTQGRETDDSGSPLRADPTETARASRRTAEAAEAVAAYPSSPRIIFLLFLGFILFFYLQGGYRIPALGAIRFEAIVGGVLSIAALLIQLTRQPIRAAADAAPPRLAGWVIALFLLMLLQVAFSFSPSLSLNVFFNRVFKFSLLSFMILSLVTNPSDLRYFLAAYLLAFMKMTQEGITGYLTGNLVWENQGVPRLHGSTPNYAHPNSLGGTQLSTLPFVVFLWGVSPLWAKFLLGALGVGAFLVAVFSGSRTAYVALGAWLAFLVYRSRSRFRTLVVIIAALGLVIPLIPAEYHARFATIFTGEEIEGSSLQAREQIWSDAWDVFVKHPLGVGVAAFPVVRQQYFGRSQDTHSLYLEIATNLGIPGLFVFTGLIITLFRSLAWVQRRTRISLDRLGCIAGKLDADSLSACQNQIAELMLIRQVASALTGFLIIRLALGLFGMDLYEIYWWFTIGLAAALVRMQVTAETRAVSMVDCFYAEERRSSPAQEGTNPH